MKPIPDAVIGSKRLSAARVSAIAGMGGPSIVDFSLERRDRPGAIIDGNEHLAGWLRDEGGIRGRVEQSLDTLAGERGGRQSERCDQHSDIG